MTEGDRPLAPAAVVITQVAVPELIAAACAGERIDVDVVPTEIGCVAVLRSATGKEPQSAARAVSRALARTGTPVVLLVQREGRLDASLWRAGAVERALAPGLALEGAPAEVEGLLLGSVSVADLPGVVPSIGVGRLAALRMVARGVRRGRRGA